MPRVEHTQAPRIEQLLRVSETSCLEFTCQVQKPQGPSGDTCGKVGLGPLSLLEETQAPSLALGGPLAEARHPSCL